MSMAVYEIRYPSCEMKETKSKTLNLLFLLSQANSTLQLGSFLKIFCLSYQHNSKADILLYRIPTFWTDKNILGFFKTGFILTKIDLFYNAPKLSSNHRGGGVGPDPPEFPPWMLAWT